ncbi:leucine--tRNA ligase [Candidatus Nomurabacteria bacterium]|nr:leucine--tRNA ligase [Candidatus Nomurabacteria bacterium]
MKQYDHKKIEKKWQDIWEKKKVFQAENPSSRAKLATGRSKRKKFYALIEFPYPSGDGLHVGHPRPYIGMDIISRKRRMQGYNVLYPIGWDAFGLPTENYAIKTGQDPQVVTKKNSDTFRRQIQSLGISFDWSREINTTDPKYYKWTQWIFLQFLKKGLAYKAKMTINWCPKDKIGLANEEVIDGKCERCGTAVEQREKEQWMLAITKYADRLYKDLDDVDYLPQIKLGQRNWIGRSEGAEIEFQMSRLNLDIWVFTTRPDTIFGATYLVLAPEHELVQKLKSQITNWNEVLQYIVVNKNKTDIERTAENKVKTGVELKGVKAINPATREEIPIWIADYVLAKYGTGAIMGVPSDDERDREFALKYNLPIVENYKKAGFENYGKKVVTFKLRDWVFSRQRYWGEPIPVINCEKCGLVPVPDKDLPVELPKLTGKIKNYQPTDTGESPLANISKWVSVKCPKCKGKAKRETDTMPNWAGSSWYYLRYTDPKNNKAFASKENLKYWLTSSQPSPERRGGNSSGVDWYNGGNEHTTLHLLYSRFWHKFLFDLKLVPTSEPYMKRTSHGLILAEGGEKMSKSRGNVINPDDIVKTYGADTLRVYEMFMGSFDQAAVWSTESIIGSRRFIERAWNLQYKVQKNKKYSEFEIEKTIKKVTEDIESMKFNTAISTLMIFVNEVGKLESISSHAYEKFLKILSPFAPHIAEELWQNLNFSPNPSPDKGRGRGGVVSIHLSDWPAYDLSKIKDEEVKIVVQINGKVRAEMMVEQDSSEESVKIKALKEESVIKYLGDKAPSRVIYVKNRLINIVV